MVRRPICEATTPAVQEALESIWEIVVEHGGAVHPDAVIREARGHLAVHCPGLGDGGSSDVLFDLPLELLVPVDGASWAEGPETLQSEALPPGLTPIQLDLLALHLDLYNAAGKIPWVKAHHPRVALRGSEGLARAIGAIRPHFGNSWDSAAEVFLATRVYSLKPPSLGRAGSEPEPTRSVILPLVDSLNHHPGGSALAHDDRAMTVVISRPLGTSECFAHYGGRRDVLDLALQHGYLDLSVRLARSAPVTVEVPDIGLVRVLAESVRASHPLDPPVVTVTDEVVALSHVTFSANHPDRFQATVDLALRGVGLSRGLSPDRASRAAESAVAFLVNENLRLLNDVVSAARADSATPAAALVGDAAAGQAAVIRKTAAQRQT